MITLGILHMIIYNNKRKNDKKDNLFNGLDPQRVSSTFNMYHIKSSINIIHLNKTTLFDTWIRYSFFIILSYRKERLSGESNSLLRSCGSCKHAEYFPIDKLYMCTRVCIHVKFVLCVYIHVSTFTWKHTSGKGLFVFAKHYSKPILKHSTISGTTVCINYSLLGFFSHYALFSLFFHTNSLCVYYVSSEVAFLFLRRVMKKIVSKFILSKRYKLKYLRVQDTE